MASLSTRKSMALLAFLARQSDRRARRQALAALLWEDAGQEQARLHVRKALWLVRTEAVKAAPAMAPPLAAAGDWLQIEGDLRIDVDAFLDALAEAGSDLAKLESACRLYSHDFLSDFSVRNAPAFEEWAAGERQRLREVALAAMRRLVDLLLDSPGATERAMEATLRLLSLDPLQEHAHRARMRLHVRQGRPAAALSHYHQLRETLQRELSVDPEPATQALFREISQARRAPERPAERRNPEPPPSLENTPATHVAPDRKPIARRAMLGLAALASVGAALVYLNRQPAPPEVARVFPITAGGLVMTGRPALSPDGSRLVFTARFEGDSNVDLFMTTLGDAQPVRLTRDVAIDDNAAWSPDGASIAFVRVSPDGSAPCRILVMTVPSGGERAVGRCRNGANTRLAWTADARRILYSDQQHADAPERLYALNVRSGITRPLTEPPRDSFGDRDPRMSRDGRTAAFARDFAGRSSDLFTLDLTTGEIRRMTTQGGQIGGLAWSADDAGLLYSSDRGGDAGLWWLPREGGEPRRIAAGLLDYRHLSHARDRRLLAFEAVRDRSEIRRLAAGNAEPRAIPGLASDGRDSFPDVARDGAIAFVSTRSGDEQLWVAERREAPRQITQLQGWRLSDPRWSPDGRRIAFAASQGGATDIYLLDRDGGPPRRLTEDIAEDAAPAWAPDGRRLYFGSRRGGASRIWRIDPFERDAKPTAVSQPGPGDLRIDPKGRWIYYLYPGRAGIWRRALDAGDGRLAGAEDQLVADFAPTDWMNWAVADDAVYYAARPTGLGSGRIRRLDLASGSITDIADAAPVHRQSSFAVDAQGALILPIRTIDVDLFGMEFNK